jgi:hypothetical protein
MLAHVTVLKVGGLDVGANTECVLVIGKPIART